MSEEPLTIDEFPKVAAAASRAVVEGNRALAVASIDRILSGRGLSRDLLLLRRARFEWRFYLTRQTDEKVVVFFSRADRPLEVVLDATASFAFEPLPAGIPTMAGAPASYRWVLPPFVVWAPSPEQVALWGPGEGTTGDNTMFLALGPSRERMLAVQFPAAPRRHLAPFGDREPAPRLTYTARGIKTIFESREGAWPLGAVLDLLAALAAWGQADPDSPGTEVPLTPGSVEARGDVVRILIALTEGWMAADAGGRLGHGGEGDALPGLLLDYGIDDLRARVLLRLGPDGRLARADEEDPLQLALHVRVGRRDDAVVARSVIRPPDFLAAGRLHEAFGELMRSEQVAGMLREALGESGADAEALASLVNAPGIRWTVFRVARRATHDTDVIVWRSAWNRRPALLIVRADFVVEAEAGEVAVRLAAEPRLRARLLPADLERVDVFEEEARYFARLLRAVYGWKRLAA